MLKANEKIFESIGFRRAEPKAASFLCFCIFNRPIFRRRSRYQQIEQLFGSAGYFFNRRFQSRRINRRRFTKSAHLVDKLRRRRPNLVIGRGRFKIIKRFDISTHIFSIPIYSFSNKNRYSKYFPSLLIHSFVQRIPPITFFL